MKTKSLEKPPRTAAKPPGSGRTSRQSAKASRQLGEQKKFRLKTIPVPIDFSPASLYPIRWARFIAHRSRARLHFVNVHDFGYPVLTSFTPPVIGSRAEVEERLRRDLAAIAVSRKVSKADFHIRAGRPFGQICQVAREIQADLIVLSTHGRTGWERAFLGSTAERLIRHSPCPVLVARQPRSRGKEAIKLRKIVSPVDFSDCSARGLNYAIELARLFGAKLALLNVIQLHHDLPLGVIYPRARINRWAREVSEAHMTELIRATDFGKVKFESEVKMGPPAQKICRYAVKAGADLIVTSTHGRTGVGHLLIGSTAEQIVRYSRSPVLVVPNR